MNNETPLKPTHGKTCPAWVCHLIDNPLRRFLEPADKHLAPLVRPGMTALDVGCGFGHYTLALARLVGEGGRVLAVDVGQRMLEKTLSRAAKAGLGGRIETHLCPDGSSLALPGDFRADLAVLGNVLHEMPDMDTVLAELHRILAPGGLLYVIEPAGHVRAARFQAELDRAQAQGFVLRSATPSAMRRRQAILAAAGEGA
ncbi:class I SAM-dependent methyltransferase [Desulfocurvus sp. DL9XJH121]